MQAEFLCVRQVMPGETKIIQYLLAVRETRQKVSNDKAHRPTPPDLLTNTGRRSKSPVVQVLQ
ncbi:hypothetical protein GCM10011385_41390 [Nitratireductor aestuarii]|uniref:Uncharacterized protein n=1 Tax=Nitratireductor aestuarii TaxID=1735103 RepID=A0A916S4E1_9HYPH|nr:hypothetical protein GCM10011385_41390 [Nitratireductor aestuarii]